MFVSQRYATAVYRSELALRPKKLGYKLERGKYEQPEIRGYSNEYLEASSPRREQMKDNLREQGIDGAAATQIAAQHTRDRTSLHCSCKSERRSGLPADSFVLVFAQALKQRLYCCFYRNHPRTRFPDLETVDTTTRAGQRLAADYLR
jgi:TrwC relaxase